MWLRLFYECDIVVGYWGATMNHKTLYYLTLIFFTRYLHATCLRMFRGRPSGLLIGILFVYLRTLWERFCFGTPVSIPCAWIAVTTSLGLDLSSEILPVPSSAVRVGDQGLLFYFFCRHILLDNNKSALFGWAPPRVSWVGISRDNFNFLNVFVNNVYYVVLNTLLRATL